MKKLIDEIKKEMYEQLADLEKEIEVLKNNISEAKQVLEKIQTVDDLEKLDNLDLEKGLTIIGIWGVSR
ncbi:unknown [Clostridium sp. CAG:510]|jgi:regulator of replication initiation timing|nr:unknown [Clostridium sp. CAG:510]